MPKKLNSWTSSISLPLAHILSLGITNTLSADIKVNI